MDCGRTEPRDLLQERLRASNPAWSFEDAGAAPDGDAELPAEAAAAFTVPGCRACGGTCTPAAALHRELRRGEVLPRLADMAAPAL
jgi:hypothetical protein